MDDTIFDFVLNGVDSSIANALRRAMISQIPNTVINTVRIKENDSKYCDDMIAHRIGQIPLKISDDYDHIDTNITLHITGPKAVYSGDIKFPKGVQNVTDNIIIIYLKKDQVLSLDGQILTMQILLLCSSLPMLFPCCLQEDLLISWEPSGDLPWR